MSKFRQFVPAAALSTALALVAATASAAGINGRVAVSDVRVGVHPDVTRVVLDVSGPAKFALDVSGNGQAVVVNLANAEWSAKALSGRHLRGAIAEMRVVDGNRLAILTDGPVHVKRAFALAPSGANGHRIVIDLADGPGSAPVAAATPQTQPEPAQVQQVAYRPMPSRQAMANGTAAQALPPARPQPQQMAAAPQPRPMPAQPATPAQRWGTPVPSAQPSTVAQARMDDGGGQRMFGVSALYVRAQTGMGFLADTNAMGTMTSAATEFDLGYVLGGALGAEMDNGFRVEGEMNYASNDISSLAGTVAGTVVNSGNVNGDVSSLSMMGNLAYDFDFGSPVKPFVLAGGGLVRVSIGNVSVGGATLADDSDWVFGYQFGGGVRYELTDQVGLEASYRFFDTLGPEFTDGTGATFDLDYQNHQFMLGAHYKF